jgi:hypothetical protein
VSQANAENIYGLMDSCSSTITSFALSTDAQWPYVTIPHFEVRGEKFFNVSSARLLAFAPVVHDKDVDAWNRYSVQEQGWIAESYRLRGDTQRNPNPIHDQVYRTDANGREEAVPESSSSSGVEYAPLWQEASAPTNVDGINYNLYSNSLFRKVFDFARMTRSAVLSAVTDPSTLFGDEAGHAQDSTDGLLADPDSILVQNVYDTFDERERQVVAALIAVLPWKVYFEGLMHDGANGLICVLRDTCGAEFTYRLDGPKAVYLGQGDHHEAEFDDLEFARPFAPFIDYSTADTASMEAHCEYSLHIFPSSVLEKAYHSRKPTLFTIAVVSVFFFTSIVFVTYDFLVQRRQQKVQAAADKSHAIVSALFPAEIRDRLFQHSEEPEQNPNSSGNQKNKGKGGVDGAKSRLKNFLDAGDTGGGANEDEENEAVPEMFDTKPIADLFPNTTVMFADIAGFTAWSSVREPSQVFTLLETVYRAFDLIAKRRRVFKVETVGDCYGKWGFLGLFLSGGFCVVVACIV